MFNRNASALLAAALVAGLSTTAQAERENPDEIVFGIIGTENRTVMREKLQPFVDDMTEQMSRPVELLAFATALISEGRARRSIKGTRYTQPFSSTAPPSSEMRCISKSARRSSTRRPLPAKNDARTR